MRFGGLANYFGVTGGFAFLDGKGDYKGLKGQGTYTGGAGYVFTVNYTPTVSSPPCAVFGDDLKIKKDKLKWKIRNEGTEPLTIESVRLFWSEKYQNKDNAEVLMPALSKVKLGSKTLAGKPITTTTTMTTTTSAGVREWNIVWTRIADDGAQDSAPFDPGLHEKDRRIDKNKTEELTLEFDKKGAGISANPWDYTILVEFEGGCAVPFVAFAPKP